MRTIEDHVRAVYDVIRENLAFWGGCQFPDFLGLLEETLGRRKPSTKGLPWLMLPIFTCEALDGAVEQAYHVSAALEVGRIAAGCLDEWQDHDTQEPLWQAIGPEQTVNVANAMIALSFLTLDRMVDSGTDAALVLALQKEFHLTLLRMAQGQHAELNGGVSVDDYEVVARAKSGSLFRLGCYAGALVAGAAPAVASLYGDFGHHLGVLIQMWNDIEGLAGLYGKRDIEVGRGLPAVATQALGGQAGDVGSVEGRTGQVYALARIEVQHRRTTEALTRCPAPGQLGLFLDTYSTRHAVDRARGSAMRQEGADEP